LGTNRFMDVFPDESADESLRDFHLP